MTSPAEHYVTVGVYRLPCVNVCSQLFVNNTVYDIMALIPQRRMLSHMHGDSKCSYSIRDDDWLSLSVLCRASLFSMYH